MAMPWQRNATSHLRPVFNAPTITHKVLELHQLGMLHAARRVIINDELIRMFLACATGGGKTLVELTCVHEGFDRGFKLIVVVAPTINLLTQHDVEYAKEGTFTERNIPRVHFRTGGDARQNGEENIEGEYAQTTNEQDIIKLYNHLIQKHGKVLIFVTYASLSTLFEIFKKNKLRADLTIFDESHHCVKNGRGGKEGHDAHWWCEFFINIASDRCLFFSASRKSGKVMKYSDVDVFGPLGYEVTFAYLQKAGIIVPNIVVKVISRSATKRLSLRLDGEMKKRAARKGFDMKSYLTEMASIVIARNDMLTNVGKSVIIDFGQRVDMLKLMVDETAFLELMTDCYMKVIVGGTEPEIRNVVFKTLKASSDAVLLQHSVVKEGIDITAFNAAVLARSLGTISLQQALGRIVRASRADKIALEAGLLMLSSKVGWNKPTAYVFVIIDDEQGEGFAKEVRELINDLIDAGIPIDDPALNGIKVELAGEDEERHNVEYDESGILSEVEGKPSVTRKQLQAIIEAQVMVATEHYVSEMANTLAYEKVKKMTKLQRLEVLCNAT